MNPGGQIQDLIARVSFLEQREKKANEEMMGIVRDNIHLKMEMDELRVKFDSSGKSGGIKVDSSSTIESLKSDVKILKDNVNELKKKNNRLEKMVKMQDQSVALSEMQQKFKQLDSMTKVLNRAMVQTHQKSTSSATGNEGLSGKYDDILERVRSLNRKTGCIDAIMEQLEILTSWKEKNETDNNDKRFKQWDEKIKTLQSIVSNNDKQFKQWDEKIRTLQSITNSLKDDKERIHKSVFCAQLQPRQPLVSGESIKLTRSVVALGPGLFHSETGAIKPPVDGAYYLGWKINQRGDGKIKYQLVVEGLQGKANLGYTEDAGDVCSGTLVIPLKKDQRVWMEARRLGGMDASIATCNFMGWQLEKMSFESLGVLSRQQQKLLGCTDGIHVSGPSATELLEMIFNKI